MRCATQTDTEQLVVNSVGNSEHPAYGLDQLDLIKVTAGQGVAEQHEQSFVGPNRAEVPVDEVITVQSDMLEDLGISFTPCSSATLAKIRVEPRRRE